MSGTEFGTRFGLRGLRGKEQTLPCLLQRQAQRLGDRPFVSTQERTRSFAQVESQVAARAGALRAEGIGVGDRVAAMVSNRWELLELELACGWIGAISVPLNTAARGAQLEYMLHTSGARRLLIEPELVTSLTGLESDRIELDTVWTLKPAPDGSQVPLQPYPPGGSPVEPADVDPGTTLMILFTSGTTGPSKGVQCPHAQLYWYGMNIAEALEITDQDVLYTCLPLFHVNAMNCFFQALVTGAEYYLDSRFSASRFWKRIAAADATVTYLLGAMIPILLKQQPRPDEQSHRLRLANGPAPPPDVDRLMRDRFGFGIIECYASTETNCVLGAPLAEQRLGFAGRAMPGFTIRVVDANDVPVPDGTPGEMLVRHQEPFAMATGYHGMHEATVDAWRNLWFHTGDRVVREADGYVRFLDRLKDSIRRRGENISSYEVEQVLSSHGDVATATVFAVPAELGEDEVMAAVVPRPGCEIDPLELVKYCEPRLAYFAVPRYVDIVEELPMTENGKVRKFVLRDRGVTDATWDLETSGYRLERPIR